MSAGWLRCGLAGRVQIQLVAVQKLPVGNLLITLGILDDSVFHDQRGGSHVEPVGGAAQQVMANLGGGLAMAVLIP